MKKLLILGGSDKLLPLIKYAVDKKYYTIICDYLLDNPGQLYANEFHHISTTDLKSVLKLAKIKQVSGLVSYSSDINALTVAYVGNKINLPSNPYHSVLTLYRKDLFRKFLKKNGFNSPLARSYTSIEKVDKEIHKFKMPFMLKPVDSAGSNGVSKITDLADLHCAYHKAMAVSKVKKIIIEDYIQMNHEYMIAGDIFVLDGKIKFMGLLNSHRKKGGNTCIPIGTSYPIFLNIEQKKEVFNIIQSIIKRLNLKIGMFNIELMYDDKGELYIIEIAPRNGGNHIPELLKIATGIDLTEILVDVSLGINEIDLKPKKQEGFYASYVIHSSRRGKLNKVLFENGIQQNIIKKTMYANKSDEVFEFDQANSAIGILFLKFNSLEEQKLKMQYIDQYVKVTVNQ